MPRHSASGVAQWSSTALRVTVIPTLISLPARQSRPPPIAPVRPHRNAARWPERTRALTGRMKVDFYHLTRSPLDRVLPMIAQRLLHEGGRLLVVADDEAARAKLDGLLWSYSSESFLPHAQAGASDDSAQ